jgi:hypothetical protein
MIRDVWRSKWMNTDATAGVQEDTLRAHLRRIRKKVKPENCVRPSEQARAAINVRWARARARAREEAEVVSGCQLSAS